MLPIKNDYLRGLEELYKKYGITEVYGLCPGTDVRQDNSYKGTHGVYLANTIIFECFVVLSILRKLLQSAYEQLTR